jgi:asparagine synthase (glutamine-hydrolysing)
MREAMRGRMPEGVRARVDKQGFPSPVQTWFRGPFYDALQDTLGSAATRQRGIYNVDVIRRDLERQRRGEINVGNSLFNIGQFERWMSGVDAPPAPAAAADGRVPVGAA